MNAGASALARNNAHVFPATPHVDIPWTASGRSDLRAKVAAMFRLNAERATREEDMADVEDGGGDGLLPQWARVEGSDVPNRPVPIGPSGSPSAFGRSLRRGFT